MWIPLLLTLFPSQTPTSALERARLAFEQGAYKDVVALAGASASESDAPRLAYLVGEAELVLDAPAAAEASFRAVLARRPQALPAQVGLGRALVAQDKLEDAGKTLDAALAAAPEDVGVLVAHGLLASRLGRAEVARKELLRAHELEPKNPWTARGCVEVLLRADDIPAAAEVAEAFASAAPRHPMGPFLMGWTMELDGEDEAALEQYRRALELDPRCLDAHKNLAILCHTLSDTYRVRERVELAYEHYRAYFELGGRDAELKRMYDELLKFQESILGESK